MNYGDIIRRSWHITWRYKALWVLGIFAGVSGCQASAGGNYGGGSGTRGYTYNGEGMSTAQIGRLWDSVSNLIPLLIAVVLVLLLLSLVFMVLSIAARGGLVTGTNAADDGRRATLTELWGAGFGRFWTLLGLDILLKLPIVVVMLVMMAGVLVPIFSAIFRGSDVSPAILAPVCGSLAIGLPFLLVLSFVLGIMYLIALRYVMLGGQGAFMAAGNGWRFFRARFKDTFLLWLINLGLNIVASVALAIPMVVVAIAIAFPMVTSAIGGEWAWFAGFIAAMVLIFWVIAMAYNAVWGTFTSALWTVFFRDVTGMSAPVAEIGPEPVQPMPAQASWAAPTDAPPIAQQPPTGFPVEPPAPPAEPPATEWSPAPSAPEPPNPPVPPAPPADG